MTIPALILMVDAAAVVAIGIHLMIWPERLVSPSDVGVALSVLGMFLVFGVYALAVGMLP